MWHRDHHLFLEQTLAFPHTSSERGYVCLLSVTLVSRSRCTSGKVALGLNRGTDLATTSILVFICFLKQDECGKKRRGGSGVLYGPWLFTLGRGWAQWVKMTGVQVWESALAPRHLYKNPITTAAVTLEQRRKRGDKRMPGVCWPDLLRSGFNERFDIKQRAIEKDGPDWPRVSKPMCTHGQTPVLPLGSRICIIQPTFSELKSVPFWSSVSSEYQRESN